MIRNQVLDKFAWLERVVEWLDRMSTLIRRASSAVADIQSADVSYGVGQSEST